MKICTMHNPPPIPIRNFDWTAIDDDTYDGLGSPVGTGPTEQAAIEDLMEQIAEKQPITEDL
jgi:hypothetical protein